MGFAGRTPAGTIQAVRKALSGPQTTKGPSRNEDGTGRGACGPGSGPLGTLYRSSIKDSEQSLCITHWRGREEEECQPAWARVGVELKVAVQMARVKQHRVIVPEVMSPSERSTKTGERNFNGVH